MKKMNLLFINLYRQAGYRLSFAKANWLPPIHSQKRIGYRLSFAKANWLPPIIRKSELATAYHSQKRIGYRLSLSLLSDSNQRPRDYKSRALAN